MNTDIALTEKPADASTPALTSDRDLVITRVMRAPPARIFRAWTDPELVKQWFAPKPYTTPVVEMDVRAGGSGLVVMRGPDGNVRSPGFSRSGGGAHLAIAFCST